MAMQLILHAFSFIGYGGSLAGNKLVKQQFVIVPVGASSYEEAMKMGTEVYQQLRAVINNKYGQDPTNVGDEAGSAPNIQEKKEVVELLKIAIDKAGYTGQVVIKSADAASEFYSSDKTYYLCFNKENNDGSQKISGDAQKVLYVFKDPFDQDCNTLLDKNLNHGGIGMISVLPCTGQSSKSVEVDPYNALASKLEHDVMFKWLFDKLRFPIGARSEAMQELIRIAREHSCIWLDDDTIMETSFGWIRSSITFTDQDMVVARDHIRPLYVAAKINGFDFQRAMMDNGSTINLMPLSTFNVACIPKKSLVPETLSITGASGLGNTLGYVMIDLQVGPIRSETCFYVMDINPAFHILLGRPWIHEFKGVASTYHQCFKGEFQGKEVVIKASQTPFESYETHLPDAFLYKESQPMATYSRARL